HRDHTVAAARLHAKGRDEEALKLLRLEASRYPTIDFEVAELALARGDADSAIASARSYLEQGPTLHPDELAERAARVPRAHLILANAFAARGEQAAALASVNKVLE